MMGALMGANDLERARSGVSGAAEVISRLKPTLLERAVCRLTGLRAMLNHDRDGSFSLERFLLLLIQAYRSNAPNVHSEKELIRFAGHRRRYLGTRCLAAGPFVGLATKIVELYSETATLCDLVSLYGLDLSDHEVAAHLLVLWNITDDIAAASAAVDPDQPGTMAGFAITRARGNVKADASRSVSLLTATKALWGMRGSVGEVRHYTRAQSVRGWLLARKRAKRLSHNLWGRVLALGAELFWVT
jgi:hypothetical protein